MSDKFIKQELKRMFKQLAKWKELTLLKWYIGDNHIHLFLVIPPKLFVSYVVRILKEKTSKWLKKKTKKFPQGALWQKGYFVSTVGINEMAVRRYIENQDRHRVNLAKLPL